MKKALFFVVFIIGGCAMQPEHISNKKPIVNTSIYPKASPDATQKFMLESNISKTDFYVEGKKIATGKRLFILINPSKSYTIEAKPFGYVKKEAFVQPPFNFLSQLSFTYLIEDRRSDNLSNISETSTEYVKKNKENINQIIRAEPQKPSSHSFAKSPNTIATNISIRRNALIIGNSNYTYSPLKNPSNDAKDIAKTLNNIGFNVSLLVDANQEEMEDAIALFGKKIANGGTGLFYYAGHGIEFNGDNYLIPTNAKLNRQKDVRYKAVNLRQLLDEMGQARNGLNIVILDACRNNPLPRSFRSSSRGLTRVESPKGTIIAYATAPGSVASDGQGRNGIYTKHLLTQIQKPGLPIEQVFKNVLRGVESETNSKQIPWMESSYSGDFYFQKEARP